ncbi:hypothetical protein D9757_000665 [Collybiopsis confluens]|uniref:Cullin family profile domain-containing protein n=1 Tax=Collybiopsis confluens TaxID=2823264 RepID=A0A8H5I1H3_9AGAR|nr:hypothetical protein D9757_000665 [Collybiopsis confluens]
MTNVFTLLQLPKTSNGFSSIRGSNIVPRDPEQLRKVARTDSDSDSASASRSGRGGAVRIRIIGGQTTPTSLPNPFGSIRHNISVILKPFQPPNPHESYEAINLRAQYIVAVENKGQSLYDHMKGELELCCSQMSKNLINEESIINYMAKLIDWYHDAVNLIRSLLSPLDQIYVPSVSGKLAIKPLAFELFNNHVLGHPEIALKVKNSFRSWMADERNKSSGERPSALAVRHLIGHLITHDNFFGQYGYEEYLLKSTEDHYTSYADNLANVLHDEPASFFDVIYGAVEEEEKITEIILPDQSRKAFKETIELAVFLPSRSGADSERLARLEWLTTPDTLKAYIDNNHITTLSKMYRLFGRLNEITLSREPLKVLSRAWKVYIHKVVSAIVTSADSSTSDADEVMVPNLLKFKARAESIIKEAFCTKEHKMDTDFTQALSDGFTSGFKTRRLKPAEMLAKYLDGMMRKGQAKFLEALSKPGRASENVPVNAQTQTSQDETFRSHLLQVLSLYRFSEDKDVFRTFYHRQLAKRLLLGRSASSDAEAGILRLLKEQYDPEFDMGESMFKDLSLSAEMMREYKKSKFIEGDDTLEVCILQRSAWPFSLGKKQLLVTAKMKKQLDAFTVYYQQKHKSRTLDWDHALGTMMLKTRFKPGGKPAVEKELSVSLYQGVILLMFQTKNELSFSEIKEVQHSMEDDDLRRTLQSLACGKKKVLRKNPVGRDVFDGDSFWFNDEFILTEEGKKAGYRIHVNSIQAKVSVKESTTTNKHIQDDRKHLLDAAIVRIMKAKKSLAYNELTMQTIDAVKKHYAPDVDEIKRRVEALVEGEYLEREEGKKGVFRYLA